MDLSVNINIEDGGYWADVPALPGCFAAGDTLDELFSSLKEGIELYLRDGNERDEHLSGTLRVKSAVLSDIPA
ncbi:MAG TPA: type II toxin-antitoxin system HicB family antitoxin [Solirubrobacterales bacterium]|jgi:predicted RNase H-like HicB family nuclease|nr:type II toxin-antitoxin system HicB family antitoxin [Solirubrobacterales bacterium]